MRIQRPALFVALVWVCVGGAKGQTKSTNCATPVTSCATTANSEIATFTVTVNAKAQARAREAAGGQPEVKRVNGKLMMALQPQHSGKTMEAALGTYIELAFPPGSGAAGFTVSPPGILGVRPGVQHLPKGVIGLLTAENEGTATIHVVGRANGVQFRNSTLNWSGYIIPNTPGPNFSSIAGEWNVPYILSDNDSDSATWIGIDGVGYNEPLLQVGTVQTYSSGFLGIFGGGTSYHPFYQIYPAHDQVMIPKPISPGDHIVAFLLAGGTAPPVPNQPSTWWVYMNNETKNWFYTAQVTYSGPLDSAEWIEEAPTSCGWFSCSVETLANYGSVTFDGSDDVNGQRVGLSESNEYWIVQGGKTVSIPSDPDGDLDGFTVAYGSTKPFPPGPFVVTTSLPEAYVGPPYSTTLQATGAASYLWLGVNLPSWLTLNENTGVLSGTPTAAGFTFVGARAVNAAETDESSAEAGWELTVSANAPPPDFAISLAPNPVQLLKPGIACGNSSTVTIVPAYGFSGVVELSLSANPSFAHLTSTAITPGQTSKVVITSNPCAVAVKDTLTLTAKSGSLTHTATLQVLPPVTVNCNAFAGEGPKPLLCK